MLQFVIVVFPEYVEFSCLDLFIQSQRYARCCFLLKPVACTFLFYAGLLSIFPLSFRFALTERDKFTQSLTSVKAALIMQLLEIHYSFILHCKFSLYAVFISLSVKRIFFILTINLMAL